MSLWGGYTYRNDSGVIGQEISWGHVSRLVFCTSHIQRELNRTLRTEIVTCAVLKGNQRKQNVIFYFSTYNETSHIHKNRNAGRVFNTLTREYCILSTISSLVSGISPMKEEHDNCTKHYKKSDMKDLERFCTYAPTLCAINSSCSTEELASIWIQSIAGKQAHYIRLTDLKDKVHN